MGIPSLRLTVAVVCLGLAPLAGVAETSDRPNVLFIITDDQAPHELSFYRPGSPLETPTLDRLADQGMVIEAAHHMGSWSGAVCTPSRHMIMTGRTVWHIPNPHGGEHVPANLADKSMPAVFNRAGYATARTCKAGNSYQAANRKFDYRRDATKRGPDGSAWHADQVLRYLEKRENRDAENPFLIYLGFSHPHDTRYGKPALLNKYGAVNHSDRGSLPPIKPNTPPLPTNWLPEHPFPHGHPNLRDEVAVEGVWKKRDEATIRNERGRYFACVEEIDRQIGRVLGRLEEMGELDETYVFFTSDHGIAIGRHGLQGKQNLYEHTWRVPLVVSGPGIEAGSRARGNIYLLDVLPTLCDLAGVETPDTVEGKSFEPVLRGDRDTVRDVLYGVYSGGTKPGIRAVKKGDWKLIKYDVLDGKVRETQLFNLAENPDELLQAHHKPDVVKRTGNKPEPHQVNLADDPKYAEKREEMEKLLLSEQKRLDDPYRLWDQPKR